MSNLQENIPGDAPFGIYLKDDRTTYRALRNAFNAAQAAWRSRAETQETLLNEELSATNETAWAALGGACATCLAETSKDLEVLSWYVASQLHGGHPFKRTSEALDVMAHLVENSITEMQPNPPEAKLKGDSETARAAEIAKLRLRPFLQLFGETEGGGLIVQPMSHLPLIGAITYGQTLLAEKEGTLDDLRGEVAERLGGEGESLTGKIEALQAMETAIGRIDVAVKRYAAASGETPPMIGYGTRLVVDVLRKCRLLVDGSGFVWPGVEESAEEEAASGGGESSGNGDASPSGGTATAGRAAAGAAAGTGGGGVRLSAGGAVTNRRDALAAIAELAGYFRQTEPHSPICLLLDRAVRWGGLSIGELYREVLSDGSVGMSQMALMTGLESQGFADSFGRRGAPTGQKVEHPTLDNYAAAVPVPAQPFNPGMAPVAAPPPAAPSPAAPAPVQQQVASPVSRGEVSPEAQAGTETEDQPEEELQMDNFQW